MDSVLVICFSCQSSHHMEGLPGQVLLLTTRLQVLVSLFFLFQAPHGLSVRQPTPYVTQHSTL